jgi:hypothetical protein
VEEGEAYVIGECRGLHQGTERPNTMIPSPAVTFGIAAAFIVCLVAYVAGVESARHQAEEEKLKQMFYSCDLKGGYTVPTRNKGEYICVYPKEGIVPLKMIRIN